ncbi:RING zinc finger protein, putative [Plasmodium reichenowi]|uniref:RING-type E3 ubiquitin transferase n=1 Tax=Plasmodium reichenowi TaxID=5854 RepID=A0A151LEZ1_PLARE|nr:RING zinc finger protein, putative [Plasmodium reichenowi]KYN97520.1 RING zinc finger protein, putative [Plasmodium reichenowi]
MNSYKSSTSKHINFINNVNMKRRKQVIEKKNILEKVHILPIKKNVYNFTKLYQKLNSLINEECILYEGFIINMNEHDIKEEEDERINKRNNCVTNKECANYKNYNSLNVNNINDDEKETHDYNIDIEEMNTDNTHDKKETIKTKNIDNHNILNNEQQRPTFEYKNNFHNDTDYIIINCVPSTGILSHDTLIYTDGKYVDNLRKIHILIIKDKHYKKYEKKCQKYFGSIKKYLLKKSNQIFHEAFSFVSYSLDCFSYKLSTKDGTEKKDSDDQLINIDSSDDVANINSCVQVDKCNNYDQLAKYTNYDEVANIDNYREVKKNKKENIAVDKILMNYLKPYFRKNQNKLYYSGKLFLINNFTFLTLKIDSDVNVGFIDKNTEIILSVDTYEQYKNVHIVPMYDTLPTTYNYDLFMDYVKPYIERHYLNVYSIHDTFFYKGVQFKIMGIDPVNIKYGKGRISCNTFIYTEGSIKPTFFDVISKESINYIRSLPFEYKPYAILNILQHLDSDSLLRLFPSSNINIRENHKKEEKLLEQLTKHKYIFNKNFKNNYTKNSLENNDSKNKENYHHINRKRELHTTTSTLKSNLINEQCAVCFEYFQDYDKCIKLTCLHTYHWKCVKNWFKFNLTCPCCRYKLNF